MHCISFFIFFLFSCENEKRKTKFEIQNKYPLNIKEIAILLIICVKNENKYSIRNFVIQFIKESKWHFGCTD